MKALISLLYTWKAIDTYYLTDDSQISWEALYILFFEFVPVTVLVLLTLSESQKPQQLYGMYQQTNSFDLDQSDSEDEFGNFNPNLNKSKRTFSS